MRALSAQRLNHRRFDFFATKTRQLHRDKESATPVDQSQYARLMIEADDGVSFPITNSLTIVGLNRAFRQLVAYRYFAAIVLRTA